MLKNKLQQHFVKFLAKHLFNVVTAKDIIQILEGGVWAGGKKLSNENVGLIAEQARNMQKSTLWKHLSNDIKFQTNLRMYNKSKTEEDFLAGKMVLWTIKQIEDKLHELGQL